MSGKGMGSVSRAVTADPQQREVLRLTSRSVVPTDKGNFVSHLDERSERYRSPHQDRHQERPASGKSLVARVSAKQGQVACAHLYSDTTRRARDALDGLPPAQAATAALYSCRLTVEWNVKGQGV